jgi:hypothetical protein
MMYAISALSGDSRGLALAIRLIFTTLIVAYGPAPDFHCFARVLPCGKEPSPLSRPVFARSARAFANSSRRGNRRQDSALRTCRQRIRSVPRESARSTPESLRSSTGTAARKVRHPSAGFFHQQNSGRRVPRIQIELPEGVQASAGHISQIQRRRPCPPHSVRAQRELLVKVNVRASHGACGWESRWPAAPRPAPACAKP